jgi:hypothetical protein
MTVDISRPRNSNSCPKAGPALSIDVEKKTASNAAVFRALTVLIRNLLM